MSTTSSITTFSRWMRSLKRMVYPDAVTIDGSIIPARHMRFGGQNFSDDAIFLQTGEKEANRVRGKCGLQNGGSILEIGCGTGRLPIGLLRTMQDTITYHGIDVSAAAIDWCRAHIEHQHPRFRFTHIDMQNDRYNPQGTKAGTSLRLPVDDASVDVIYLYSVFSHMEPEDVKAYAQEFRRILKNSGTVFLTTFIEDNVPDFTVNPSEYRRIWKGALHCTRFERTYFDRLMKANGLRITHMDYAKETDGQSGIYLAKCS